MLRNVAAFEFRYQVRSPVFWIGCLLFFMLTFASVVIDTGSRPEAGLKRLATGLGGALDL